MLNILEEVEKLYEKGVIECVPKDQRGQGYYSTFFTVPKKKKKKKNRLKRCIYTHTSLPTSSQVSQILCSGTS